MIPKVEFCVRKIEEDYEVIIHFLNLGSKKNSWDWSQIVFKIYPKLEENLKKGKTKSKKKEIVRKFFKEYYKENKKSIEGIREKFQEEWNKISDGYMNALSEVLEIKWSKQDKKIYALLSLNPICPRWIKERTFNVYYNFDLNVMKSISMHEILHFLWFEKWKQIFPETNEKEFDSPYLVWKLSEIVPKAILSDEKIQKIFKHKPLVYDEWKFARINGKPLLSQIGEIYHYRKNFEDFVRKTWEFIKKHEKEINKI